MAPVSIQRNYSSLPSCVFGASLTVSSGQMFVIKVVSTGLAQSLVVRNGTLGAISLTLKEEYTHWFPDIRLFASTTKVKR